MGSEFGGPLVGVLLGARPGGLLVGLFIGERGVEIPGVAGRLLIGSLKGGSPEGFSNGKLVGDCWLWPFCHWRSFTPLARSKITLSWKETTFLPSPPSRRGRFSRCPLRHAVLRPDGGSLCSTFARLFVVVCLGRSGSGVSCDVASRTTASATVDCSSIISLIPRAAPIWCFPSTLQRTVAPPECPSCQAFVFLAG